jgi:hypothetical protein
MNIIEDFGIENIEHFINNFYKLYPNCTIINKYISSADNRCRIMLRKNNKKYGMSYAKFLMQLNLGRLLSFNETVDHIDNNPLNNKLSNLQLLSRKDNNVKSSSGEFYVNMYCPNCGTEFAISFRNSHYKMKNLKHNFCSRKCSGEFATTKKTCSFENKEKEFIFLRFPKEINRPDVFIQMISDYLKDTNKYKMIKTQKLKELGIIPDFRK